jgi:RND family efflux transporter MFP subunit
MTKTLLRPWLALTCLVFLVLGGFALRLPLSAAHANVSAGTERETLPVTVVTARDIRQSIEVPGEFRPYQETDIDAKVRGYVLKLGVDVGDAVKKGQLLATLEIPELADDLRSAAAAVAVARQQAARARAQAADDGAIYQRLMAVARQRSDLIAQQDLDQAKARADGSLAALTAGMSAIRQAEANQLRVRDTQAYARIEAPYDGVITARMVDEGALVGAASGGAGGALFHLADVRRLRLVLKVPESAVPDVSVGRQARVTVPALGGSFDLPVSRLSHQLAQATRTMHVEIDFDNSAGRVAPGMYADIDLPLQLRAQVAAVPLSTLHERAGDAAKVYVLAADGRVQERFVALGLSDPRYIEIKTGLEVGEQVVVDVMPQLDPSMRYAARQIHEG